MHCGVIPITEVSYNEEPIYILPIDRRTKDFCIFGGKSEVNENYRQTALREFREESDNSFTVLEILEEIIAPGVYILIVKVEPIIPSIDNKEVAGLHLFNQTDLSMECEAERSRSFKLLIPGIRLLLEPIEQELGEDP